MSNLAEALALYDTASQIDRVRLQLHALPPTPTVPPLREVTAQVHTLAGITTAVSDKIIHLTPEDQSLPEKRPLQAYSNALAPLCEAMTELGRLQAEVTQFRYTARPAAQLTDPSLLDDLYERTGEIITGCREAADEILDAAAKELRKVSTELSLPPNHVQPSALARSPHAPSAAQSPFTAVAVPPGPSGAAPHAARGR